MTERQSHDLVDILRSRLGPRYRSSIDEGRSQMAGALCDELRVSRAEADGMINELIDSGRIRYVTGTESDAARGVTREDGDVPEPRTDEARVTVIPGGGAPQTSVGGMSPGAAPPVVAGGYTTPPPVPVASGVPLGEAAELDPRMGYWDFGEGGSVVPSRSRKGQVEPSGT